MSSVSIIEKEIESLPKHDYIILREWFQNFDSKKWDTQIETDIKNGKLDELANCAISDFRNEKYKAI